MAMRSAAFLLALLAGACAHDGAGLRVGASTEADVRSAMGAPALELNDADGSRALVYPRGPLGRQTYMAELGADGRLVGVRQALDDGVFNGIRPGMTREEVLRLIGPPGDTMSFPRLGHVAWDYRYTDTWGYLAIFSVTFDAQGRVVSKISQRIERRDPAR